MQEKTKKKLKKILNVLPFALGGLALLTGLVLSIKSCKYKQTKAEGEIAPSSILCYTNDINNYHAVRRHNEDYAYYYQSYDSISIQLTKNSNNDKYYIDYVEYSQKSYDNNGQYVAYTHNFNLSGADIYVDDYDDYFVFYSQINFNTSSNYIHCGYVYDNNPNMTKNFNFDWELHFYEYYRISSYCSWLESTQNVDIDDNNIVPNFLLCLEPSFFSTVIDSFSDSFSQGYTTGVQAVKSNPNGYDLYTKAQYDSNYTKGYNAGLEFADNNNIPALVMTIFNAPVNMLGGMLDFEIFGVNIKNLVFFLLTTGIVIWIISIFKGKGA